jgi:hypothetical protein
VLLNGTFSLLGITDVERFCGRVVKQSRLRLSAQDEEEFHTHLIESAWELSLKHDPARGAFSVWVGYALRRRAVDWQRTKFGRTRWKFAGRIHERPRTQVVSLDDSGHDRLDAALRRSSVDRDESGFAAGMRILDARGCRPGRRDDWLGDEAA